MEPCSKIIVILGFLLATAFAERKINLEDIERDNLRAESKSDTDDTRTEESSYSVTDKPVTSQSDYRQESQYQNEERSSSYNSPQQLQDKYAVQPEEYEQEAKYLDNNIVYQKSSQPIQHYEYQQQQQQQVEPEVPKGLSQASTYEAPRQLFYQQEVIVGNQYQTVKQKEATEKYSKSPNKESLYVNIPMTQLLSYYPNLSPSQSTFSKTEIQPLLHRLATEAARQITIPVYTPAYSREPIYSPSKVAYQIQPQYQSVQSSKYPKHTQAILPTKQPVKLIYSQTSLSHQRPATTSQPHQYLQEIVYTQPGAIYAPEVSSSHDVYATPSVHLRVNGPSQSYAIPTRHQQQYTAYTQPERYYALQTAHYPPQVTNQIYQEHTNENLQQNYENIPEAPVDQLDLPRLPAQNFKPEDGHRSVPVANENEESHYTQNHLDHSQPQSLLESYVPSRLIAAQDSERYRERPIRLERGFLPSKINFGHSYKKRKAE